MADSENQQAISQTKQKIPKRVDAGKAVAERIRIAREAQKKALLAFANSVLISAKHVDFSVLRHPSRDSDGYPLTRVAAGKAVAERTRIAREAQKKALAFANSVLISAEVKQFLN